ncbi:MAG: HEAT repeat domain-containing protein, partial [Planctomycetes bacterium]|nr:HEAT repeat domain-containing protein [Planctomycetota bacterium]
GVEIDSAGRIFSGHNGGDTRGFHYVQGGYYAKSFGKHGPLSNPYAFGHFEAMAHHAVPRFTHNFVIYESAALPEPYRGRLYGVEPLQGQVVMSEIQPDRSSFKTKDLDRVIKTSDPQFRPVDIKVGPDGAIYVADFYEPQISHREHFSGQIDKSNGRIYRLRSAAGSPTAGDVDLASKTSQQLVESLQHPGKWHRQTALRLLGDRRDASIVPLLKENIRRHVGQFALENLWALHQTAGLEDDFVLESLAHEDAHVRLWTVRLLCDAFHAQNASATHALPPLAKGGPGGVEQNAQRQQLPSPLHQRLQDLAETEAYVQVRSQLASSARRLPASGSLPIVRRLLARDEDAGDIHVPLLLWWAIEAKAGEDPAAVVAMFEDSDIWKLPLVEQHIVQRLMRRFAQSGSRNDLLNGARLFELAPEKKHTDLLMQGFEEAFRGRTLAGLPAELVDALAKAGGGSLILSVRQGKPEAVREAIVFLSNATTDPARRLELIQLFGEVNHPDSVPALLEVVRSTSAPELRKAALTSLGRYTDERIGGEVVALYPRLPEDVREAARTLLVSRSAWAAAFLAAIDAGVIDPATVPLDDVRKLTVHQDERIASLVKKHWNDIQGASTAEMQAQIDRIAKLIALEGADPSAGKELYTKSCGKCHLLFGEGGRIGPDLTTYQRKDTLQVLINVVNPSAEVREGFETWLIVTDDGRTATGFLYDQDNRVVLLRGTDGQNITIPRDRIEEQIKQPRSLMPEGLLKDLADEEIRNLFAYLKSSQPLN